MRGWGDKRGRETTIGKVAGDQDAGRSQSWTIVFTRRIRPLLDGVGALPCRRPWPGSSNESDGSDYGFIVQAGLTVLQTPFTHSPAPHREL